MIQAYINTNKDFSKNGDMVLMPTTCALSAKLNGTWTVKLVHPIDAEGRWRYITDEAVIRMPSFNGSQLFRVYERKKSDKGVEAKLLPIFFDAAKEVFIVDKRPTYVNGQQALDILTVGTDYQAESNIETPNTAYYIRKNLLECISGKDDNAFIKRWGGEAIYNNYKIVLNARAGTDNGVTVRYGLNMQTNGLEETVNLSGVMTRVYPQGYNGAVSSEPVDSPLINNYPNIRYGVREYPNVRMASDINGQADEGIIVCHTQSELDTALRAAVEKDFADGLDKPEVTLKVKMVLLQNMEEYKDYKNLQAVSLGDTVHAFHTRLQITTALRVCELTYDAITEKVSEVVLGAPVYNYFDSQQKTLNQMGGSIADVNGTAKAAQMEARQAQRTADETKAFFWYDDEGAHVATVDGDASSGKNVLIDADGMAIRNGTADLATFGENVIELGKSNDTAEIKLLDDTARLAISIDENNYKWFRLNGRPLADGGPNCTGIVNSVPQSAIDAGHKNAQLWCQTNYPNATDPDDGRIYGTADHIYFHAAKKDGNGNDVGNLRLHANQIILSGNKITAGGMPVIPYNTYTYSGTPGVYLHRVLNMVICTIHKGSNTITSGTSFFVGSIPVGYRPNTNIVFTGMVTTSSTPQGMARVIAGQASGTSVGSINATANVTGTYVLFANCVWMTDD